MKMENQSNFREMWLEREHAKRADKICTMLIQADTLKREQEATAPFVVLDLETTGLEAWDEVLQVSMIDRDNNILINSYVKPYWHIKWKEAEVINGITKDKVMNAPYLHELLPAIRNIIGNATTLVGYNLQYDLHYLHKYGVWEREDTKQIDVMEWYAPLAGQVDYKRNQYKWVSLVECAKHFGYTFEPHDSLEDVRATLHCCKALECVPQSRFEEAYQWLEKQLGDGGI